MAMKVRKPAYSDVTDLDLKLYVSGLCHPCASAEAVQLRIRTECTLFTSLPSSAPGYAVSIPSPGGGDPGISRAVPEVTSHLFSGLRAFVFYRNSANLGLTDSSSKQILR